MERTHTMDPFPPGAGPVPGSAHESYVRQRLLETGRWGEESFAQVIAGHAQRNPDGEAFIEGPHRMTWSQYDERSSQIAGALIASGYERGERVAVYMPDGPGVHAAFVGAEKAGLAAVGIGPRAGFQEIRHLMTVAGATGLVTATEHREQPTVELFARLGREGLPVRHHLVVDDEQPDSVLVDGSEAELPERQALDELIRNRRLGVGDIFLINSTSGTTGMPKCVVHTENRWIYYHTLAVEAGEFTPEDRFFGLIPAPFGFGVWTAHTTPALLGSPTAVMRRFTPEGALALIERERLTVLSAVSTQFIMMLNSPALTDYDLSSLRALFTGGEAVPYKRAAEFEERTGCRVLQFYGSNETGALSRTRMTDTRDQRLRTAGRVIDEMQVRLFDTDGEDVTARGGPGQAACSGPATCLGYFNDPDANAKFITEDGWMLTGDICEIDDGGYLRVVGRTSDFIIRGGKNISAAAVEEQAATHPAVALAAAVPMPDEVFGERVCLYVVLQARTSLTLDELVAHLTEREVSKELFPERLEIVDELPRSSGGKIAKGQLRADVRRLLEHEEA